MTVGLGQAWFPAWKNYKQEFEKRGKKVVTLDLYNPGWAERLKRVDKNIDFYFWHSDTWEENYRRIHDRVYFIEHILKKPVFPDMNQYFSYNDKIKQKEIFDFLGLPQIKTIVAQDKENALRIINEMSYPAVIKDAYSACGESIWKVDSLKQCKEMVEKIFDKGYEGVQGYLYIQEFIPGLDGDLRIITIGSRIATAYWRKSARGWRHNICQGAKAEFINIPKKAQDLCLRISKKMKFHWMSYDIILIKNQPKILEWSCNFGCNAPRAHGLNIRGMMADHALKNYKKFYAK